MTGMTGANTVLYSRIQKPEDYQISFSQENNIEIAIHSEQGRFILAIDRNMALTIAVDLIKKRLRM
jgi:hypothetical protein